jgi:hypothetical protein
MKRKKNCHIAAAAAAAVRVFFAAVMDGSNCFWV